MRCVTTSRIASISLRRTPRILRLLTRLSWSTFFSDGAWWHSSPLRHEEEVGWHEFLFEALFHIVVADVLGGLGAYCQQSYQRVPSKIRRAHQLHGVFTDAERARHVVRWENRGSCVCTCVHALIQFITNSTPVGRGLWARFLFSRTSSTLPHTSILQKK